MGTQGTGRKRNPNKERSTVEEDALKLIAREAEARLAAKRAARAEAREIRMKELERQQKEISDDEEHVPVGIRDSARAEDRDYLEKGSRKTSIKSSTTLTSLGGTSSRRGSGETSITVDTETSIRDIKEIHELKDQIQDVETKYVQNLKEVKDAMVVVEEKYRKAMVSNAQLDNEKNNLMYYVDTLKDSLMELEELLSESRRDYEEKTKEYEREKHNHSVLQFQFNELKETIKQSEELLTKHGIVLCPDLSVNGETIELGSEGPVISDLSSRPALDLQTSPTEGNSILGRTDEIQLDCRREMVKAPEQQEDMHDENCPISCNMCSLSHNSVKQPCREEHGCFSVLKNEVKSAISISELNTEVSDLRKCPKEVVTVDDCFKDRIGENAERKSAGDLRGTNDVEPARNRFTSTYLGTQVSQCGDDIDGPQELLQEQLFESENDEFCQTDVRDFDPNSPSGELVLDKIKTDAHGNEIHRHFELNFESEKYEETQELSQVNDQPQTTASSRKKKKKKKGKKKKGGIQEDEIQEGNMQEKSMSEKIKVDVEELTGLNDSSATESLKESQAKLDKDDQTSVNKRSVRETHNEVARNSVPLPNKEANVNIGDPSDHIKIQTILRDTSKDRFESTSKTPWPESESIDCSKEESTNVYNLNSNTDISTSDKNYSGNNESLLSFTDSTFELTTNSSLKDPVLEFSTSITAYPAWSEDLEISETCSRENDMGFSGVKRAAKPENTPQSNNTLATSPRNEAYRMCHNTSSQPYCNTPEYLSCLAKSQLPQDHVDEGLVLAKDVEDPTSHDSLKDEGFPSYSLEEKQKDPIVDEMEDEETSQESIEIKSENEHVEGKLSDNMDLESIIVGSAIAPEEAVPGQPDGSTLEKSKNERKVLQNNVPIVQEEKEEECSKMVMQVENMCSASRDLQPPQSKGKDSEQQLYSASEGNRAVSDSRDVLGKVTGFIVKPQKTPETVERESVTHSVEEGVEAINFGLHGT